MPSTATSWSGGWCRPSTWSHGNPIDILGDASGKRYNLALEALANDKSRDAVLVLNCPTAVADSLEAAKAVVETANRFSDMRILTSWLGESAAAQARHPTLGFLHVVQILNVDDNPPGR